ncbi:hypothetical protein OFN05_17470, partial [Acinetobacter baumannii]|nr:hypothetical protein [Acinetobacter baumannii]
RNRYNVERPEQLDFDLQIFVANWPSARAYAWKTLLRARAIENLCFVAAVNRVGVDGNQLHYAGDSAVIDFLGQPQVEIREREQVVTTIISAEALAAHRARFPAMLDADAFHLDEQAWASRTAAECWPHLYARVHPSCTRALLDSPAVRTIWKSRHEQALRPAAGPVCRVAGPGRARRRQSRLPASLQPVR